MSYKAVSVDETEDGMSKVRGGVPFWTVPGAPEPQWKTSYVRVLPPRDDHPDNTYYFWVATHGNLPGGTRPVLCPAKMFDEPCPACALANSLWNAGNKTDARKFFASWRAMVNIIVLNKDGSLPDDAEVKVWGMPKGVMESLQAKLKERPKSERDIANPIGGYNIKVRRTGTGKNNGQDTKYEIDPMDTPSDLPDDAIDLLDNMIALDQIYARVNDTLIAGLLAAPKTESKKLASPPSNVWDDDEDEEESNAIESSYRVIDEEEDEAPAPPPPPRRDKPADPRKAEAQSSARDRLMAKLKTAAEPEEEDEEEDE